jgi:hypothetical protein
MTTSPHVITGRLVVHYHSKAFLAWPARDHCHCGYVFARNRRRARNIANGSDPYGGLGSYLLEVRRLPLLDGLCPSGTTIWEPAEIPNSLRDVAFDFQPIELLMQAGIAPRQIRDAIQHALRFPSP